MEKRYLSANRFYREKFGTRVIKAALDGGFTCPNRDGTKGRGGCIFCSAKGSGDFAGDRNISITDQFYAVKKIMDRKWKDGQYMAYFQAFTNTYAPTEVLKEKFSEALAIPEVCALSIATRPDCLEEDKLSLISELNSRKYTCVELGLQTSNESTAKLINRCYKNEVFTKAVKELKSRNIDVIAHVILGLPHENREDMLNTVRFAVSCGIKGIKLQLLHVLKGTKLCEMYERGEFNTLSVEEYADIVADCIEALPPWVVVHRITGDGNGRELVAPLYSKNKKLVLNTINKVLLTRNSFQSKTYKKE